MLLENYQVIVYLNFYIGSRIETESRIEKHWRSENILDQ